MFKELSKVVLEKDFKMIIYINKINIVNYDDVIVFEDDNILIKALSKYIRIKGSNLLINKLYDRELLIEGDINTIDMGD